MMRSRSETVAKNTFFMAFRMVLVVLVGLYTSRVILDKLGVDDFGIYNVVWSVVVLFSFLQNALTNATYRFLAYDLGLEEKDDQERSKLRRTFSMSMNVHLLLGIAIFILCETIGLWIVNYKLVIPTDRMYAANLSYQFAVFCFILNIVKTPYNSLIIVHEKMNFYAYTSVLEAVMKLLIVYLLSMSSFDKLILYSFLILVVTLILFIWYKIQCKRSYPESHYMLYWNTDTAKSMVKYSGWSLLVNGVDVGVNQSIVYFYNVFFGVVVNAAYGIANQVSTHLNQFLNSFASAYNPQIIKSYSSGDRSYFMKLVYSSSKFSFYILFLISMPIIFNLDYVLGIWLKEVPESSSILIIMLMLYSFIDAYSAPLWISVHATGNLRTHQILMASIKIVNIPLAYILLEQGMPAWGVLAIKAGLNFVCSVVRPIYMVRLIGLDFKHYMKNVFFTVYLVAGLSLPIPFFLSSLCESDLERFLVSSFSFVLIFSLVAYYIGLTDKEKMLAKDMTTNKLKKIFKR